MRDQIALNHSIAVEQKIQRQPTPNGKSLMFLALVTPFSWHDRAHQDGKNGSASQAFCPMLLIAACRKSPLDVKVVNAGRHCPKSSPPIRGIDGRTSGDENDWLQIECRSPQSKKSVFKCKQKKPLHSKLGGKFHATDQGRSQAFTRCWIT